MAPWAGQKLQNICDNLEHILAIELLAAARAIEAQAPLKATAEIEDIRSVLRKFAPALRGDRRHDIEIAAVGKAISRGEFLAPLAAATELDTFTRH